MISPSRASPIASAAFLTRFRNTCSSWSRFAERSAAATGRSPRRSGRGGEAAWASRRTRSSTSWMLTGSRSPGAGRRTPPCGRPACRSARPRRGSAAVSSRSASPTDFSSSCAAPRMPESGFLISCASIAASAGHRARGRRGGRAAVHLVGHALLVHQDQDLAVASPAAARRGRSAAAAAGRAQPTIDVVLRHRDAAAPRLPDHVEHRAVEPTTSVERPPGASAAARRRRSSRSPGWRSTIAVGLDEDRPAAAPDTGWRRQQRGVEAAAVHARRRLRASAVEAAAPARRAPPSGCSRSARVRAGGLSSSARRPRSPPRVEVPAEVLARHAAPRGPAVEPSISS